jgi:hypothetical protein
LHTQGEIGFFGVFWASGSREPKKGQKMTSRFLVQKEDFWQFRIKNFNGGALAQYF